MLGLGWVFLVVMVVILTDGITNRGTSTAGRRRGVLPSQAEQRQDRTEQWEAAARRGGAERDERGSHPTSCCRGAGWAPGRGLRRAPRARLGLCGTSPGAPGETEGGRAGGAACAGTRGEGDGRLKLRRCAAGSDTGGGCGGTRLGRGQPGGAGHGRGGRCGGICSRAACWAARQPLLLLHRNPASHGGGIDRVRAPLLPAAPPTLGQAFVSDLPFFFFFFSFFLSLSLLSLLARLWPPHPPRLGRATRPVPDRERRRRGPLLSGEAAARSAAGRRTSRRETSARRGERDGRNVPANHPCPLPALGKRSIPRSFPLHSPLPGTSRPSVWESRAGSVEKSPIVAPECVLNFKVCVGGGGSTSIYGAWLPSLPPSSLFYICAVSRQAPLWLIKTCFPMYS